MGLVWPSKSCPVQVTSENGQLFFSILPLEQKTDHGFYKGSQQTSAGSQSRWFLSFSPNLKYGWAGLVTLLPLQIFQAKEKQGETSLVKQMRALHLCTAVQFWLGLANQNWQFYDESSHPCENTPEETPMKYIFSERYWSPLSNYNMNR